MTIQKITYKNSPCYILAFNPTEVRLDTTLGAPGKREKIDKIFGDPRIDEVTAYRQNCTFFNMAAPSSEVMGEQRGDKAFINFGYDGQKLHIEPDLPANLLWETSGGYSLIRNGRSDYAGEEALKSILGSNPRSMIGQSRNGNIYAIIAEGRLFGKGLTSEEQRALGKLYGLQNMMNLDGGGSAVMYVYDTRYGKSYDGRLLGKILVGYAKYNLSELPVCRKGSKGVYVHLLQRLLNQFGSNLTLDGSFGNATLNAVQMYQLQSKLKMDGICGPNTWKSLVNRI